MIAAEMAADLTELAFTQMRQGKPHLPPNPLQGTTTLLGGQWR